VHAVRVLEQRGNAAQALACRPTRQEEDVARQVSPLISSTRVARCVRSVRRGLLRSAR
jgi:hypothetical protein